MKLSLALNHIVGGNIISIVSVNLSIEDDVISPLSNNTH